MNGIKGEPALPVPETKLSKPLLPPKFIKKIESEPKMKGFRSIIYSPEDHRQRILIRNWNDPLNPDIFTAFPNGECGFDRTARRTVTHLRALQGDILALCELIRCGANPDYEDTNGVTPIFVAMDGMKNYFLPGYVVVNLEREMMPFTTSEIEENLFRDELVVRTLVEQHVDVNRCIGNVSLIHLACMMKHWGIIQLLLEHGAKMTLSQSAIEHCFSRAEQARFHAIVKAKSLPPDQERPPQVCPCWSGKLLKDCHVNEQPYPPKFICICGSAKTYEKCCMRKEPVIERWSNERRRIVHYFEGNDFPRLNDHELDLECHQELVRNLGCLIDPAFAYALNRSAYMPIARGKNFSRKVQEGCQQRWNALIDEYIALGVDRRSAFDIERAGKIGVRAGALIRMCEGCWRLERRGVESLKVCAKCHIAVYCSSSCQRDAWSMHKEICGKEGQKAQQLPSQYALESFQKNLLERKRGMQDLYDQYGPRPIYKSPEAMSCNL